MELCYQNIIVIYDCDDAALHDSDITVSYVFNTVGSYYGSIQWIHSVAL